MAVYRKTLICSKAETTYGATASTNGTDYLVTLADASITPLSAESRFWTVRLVPPFRR